MGYMIWNSWRVLTVATMYVGLLVIAIRLGIPVGA
jgi:ABC-type nitrate/sulfonate/bicarbonate transport system permease component